MSSSDADVNAIQYLENHSVLCLATSRGQSPWVSPVFYARYRDTLVFLSAPHTRHARNLKDNPLVSASIQEDYNDWTAIKGIQLEGVVTRVEADLIEDVVQCYSKKFPVTGKQAPPEIAKAISKINWNQLRPEIVYFIDNSKGLGHREQVNLLVCD